jgi:hypothetical protein
MRIHDRAYSIEFDPQTGSLTLAGRLTLMTRDYEPMRELLDHVLRLAPPRLDVDIQRLRLINSSGLNILSRFVLGLRARPAVEVVFHGSSEVVWQAKTLANMKCFLPSARLIFH